jgi:2-polyprenyl-6-methoxyphenol hydroxylase-like FAD-dependent oxidoreductase
MPDPQVLIAGAGPTGLVLALWLTRLGVRVRIIDKAAEPGTTSRALVVHARTLEFYRQLGLAEDVLQRGLRFASANLWVKRRRAGRVEFGATGKGLSPFPYLVIYPQDEHERLLIERLAGMGVRVERSTELIGCDDLGTQVRARLRRSNGAHETFTTDYLAGCDGARSTVREVLGVGFAGSTYDHLFYVADVEAAGPVMNRELHVALDEADFLAVFPLSRTGNARLIGTARIGGGTGLREEMTWDDVGHEPLERLRIGVERVNWFSTYRVHHRVADRFRAGRIFLLGDAAHIHSPVGGQGMNTGIGDAVNLAWKLSGVLRGRAHGAILDTYEPERIAFARRLVATTDRAFTLVTSGGPVARVVRLDIVPRVLPALFRLTPTRRLMFRTLSQIAIHYRGSRLSEGEAGRVAGGDRLPWVPDRRWGGDDDGDNDNFRPLRSLDWQVHVYGRCPRTIEDACGRRGIALHVFPWQLRAGRAGLRRDAVYLVRPDGYVAFADADGDAVRLDAYLDDRGIRPLGH